MTEDQKKEEIMIDVMKETAKEKQKEPEIRSAQYGTYSRNNAYKQTYRQTGDHRAAIRAYCSGNKWLTENAKAVGNW